LDFFPENARVMRSLPGARPAAFTQPVSAIVTYIHGWLATLIALCHFCLHLKERKKGEKTS